MAKLAEPVKAFIVEHLACFDSPQQVADLVKEEFGVVCSRQLVECYDPLKKCRTKKWVALHAATRKAFLDQSAGLAITHRAWRMRELEDMVRKAKKSKNYKLASELLEQAAKEQGEIFTNHRAKEPVAETEEQRVARMRAQLEAMDVQTIGAIAPALTVADGGAAA